MAAPSSGTPTPVSREEQARLAAAKPTGEAAAAAPPAEAKPKEWTVERRLFTEAFGFDFFQAVRVLEKLQPTKRAVGHAGSPATEIVRFKAHISLTFPPSAIYDLVRPVPPATTPVPAMTVAFMGLTGPSGMLPRHYTELLLRLEKEAKGPERFALRDWIDLFNHRFISLFYRAWEKYRFYIPYERGEYARTEPDPYTLALYSLVGLGLPPLRERLHVSLWEVVEEQPRARPLAKVDDLALLYYAGYLAHRPRNAVSLEGLLGDYFQLPVRIQQFQGQWLCLDPENQSQLGAANNQLGVSVVAGERVWDVQSQFRVRLGPLRLAEFVAFLPDRSPVVQRKAFFVLTHLVRLYAGPEFDFQVQLVLRAADVPECQLSAAGGLGPRLGWNTWVRSQPMTRDAEEAVFAGDEVLWLNQKPTLS